MALQFSDAVNNARLDAFESTIGASAKLRIYTGLPPANCAAADGETLLAEMTLPADWMNAASGSSKTLLGSWTDASANASGTAGHFRIMDNAGTTCHCQGTVSEAGNGGDAIVDSVAVVATTPITCTQFTLAEATV